LFSFRTNGIPSPMTTRPARGILKRSDARGLPSRVRLSSMHYFPILSGLFVSLLMISQVTAVKPVEIGIAFTGADVLFPLVYLLGDVITEVYGFARSRIVIWTGLFANLLMSGAIWLVGMMPGEAEWLAAGGQAAWDMLL